MADTTFKPLRTAARFVKVTCADCSTPRIVFARAATKVDCESCGAQLVKPTGGLAEVHGDLAEEL